MAAVAGKADMIDDREAAENQFIVGVVILRREIFDIGF